MVKIVKNHWSYKLQMLDAPAQKSINTQTKNKKRKEMKRHHGRPCAADHTLYSSDNSGRKQHNLRGLSPPRGSAPQKLNSLFIQKVKNSKWPPRRYLDAAWLAWHAAMLWKQLNLYKPRHRNLATDCRCRMLLQSKAPSTCDAFCEWDVWITNFDCNTQLPNDSICDCELWWIIFVAVFNILPEFNNSHSSHCLLFIYDVEDNRFLSLFVILFQHQLTCFTFLSNLA